jgi:hypothetical protein
MSGTRFNVNRLGHKMSSPALWNGMPAVAKELSKGRGAVGGDGRTLSGCCNRVTNILKVGPLPRKLACFHFPHEHGERVDVNALSAPLVAVRFRRHVPASANDSQNSPRSDTLFRATLHENTPAFKLINRSQEQSSTVQDAKAWIMSGCIIIHSTKPHLGVPARLDRVCMYAPFFSHAKPKSASLRVPRWSTRRFSGLMSRCTTLQRCKYL